MGQPLSHSLTYLLGWWGGKNRGKENYLCWVGGENKYNGKEGNSPLLVLPLNWELEIHYH